MKSTSSAGRVINKGRARLKLRTRLRAFAHPAPAHPANGALPTLDAAGPVESLPARRTAPGSWTIAPGTGFIDQHPRFLDTSTTAATRSRLNLRHEAIITDNKDVLEGARVLDIASHDARWTYAALRAGASHVTGAEGRPELVAHAEENLQHYGVDPDRYRFIVGDIFTTLDKERPQADVVLCLGFLYHTMRYDDVFHVMSQSNAEFLILDTQVEPSREAILRVRTNGVVGQGSAFTDSPIHTGQVLVGRPSVRALRTMAWVYGYRLDRFSDWSGILEDNPPGRTVKVYRAGARATLRFKRDPSLGTPPEE
ncbi:hypothetical protein HNR19_004216 [Nocardioides thalensis]|uniref:Methyltransferase domain-containing protein n=1 Tax=Nocardioides thalensis TaxID=1914755 RepID=A0A853CAR9_9ACTN|nr:hypothetical protein [Nocardioides thalensis]